jgi:hypothetical protein
MNKHVKLIVKYVLAVNMIFDCFINFLNNTVFYVISRKRHWYFMNLTWTFTSYYASQVFPFQHRTSCVHISWMSMLRMHSQTCSMGGMCNIPRMLYIRIVTLLLFEEFILGYAEDRLVSMLIDHCDWCLHVIYWFTLSTSLWFL